MNTSNPLEIQTFSENTLLNRNKRGRPNMTQETTFSPQPKSLIISQLMNNRIEEKDIVDKHNNLKSYVEEVLVNENEERMASVNSHSNRRDSKHAVQQYSCDYPDCLYTCKLSCNLTKHKRIHTTEKPYLCDQCTFRTNFINSLKVHRRIHSAEKPYNCQHCDYRCNSISNLKKHVRHRHPDNSQAKTLKSTK